MRITWSPRGSRKIQWYDRAAWVLRLAVTSELLWSELLWLTLRYLDSDADSRGHQARELLRPWWLRLFRVLVSLVTPLNSLSFGT